MLELNAAFKTLSLADLQKGRAKVEKRLIVDRIEGDLAMCEADDLVMTAIPLSFLPDGVTEGDVLVFNEHLYTIGIDTHGQRRLQVQEKMDTLFKG